MGKTLELHRKRKEARLGKKDLTGKQLEEYADVFVDIYNHLLFEKEYLQEKGLQHNQSIIQRMEKSDFRTEIL